MNSFQAETEKQKKFLTGQQWGKEISDRPAMGKRPFQRKIDRNVQPIEKIVI